MLKECVQQLLYDNGLSAGEKFFIVNLKGAKLNGIFYINTNAVKTRDILKCSDDDRDYTYILASLLNGEYLIKAISYYPEQGNEFYFIDIKSEGVLTTTQYRHVEEFVDMCEDWVNYLNRIERN